MFDSPGIPKGLAEIPPGAFLGGVLESIDREKLSGHDLVVLMRAERRQSDHYQARFYASMNAVARSTAGELADDLPPESVQDLAASEIRAALTLTRRSAASQMDFAQQLVDDYPAVWGLLKSGELDVPRAMVIVNHTCHLERGVRDRVVEAALERARSQTTGQLAARLRRLAISVDPESAKKSYQQAVEERMVTSEANPDGTANLYGLQLPAAEAQAAMRRINRLARAARHAADPRSIDQLRADIFLDLLHGRAHEPGDGGTVDITVELTTLAGLLETPGELNGYGPVIADIARQVAHVQTTSTHRATVTENGEPVWTGTTRRRPTVHQTRQIEVQNPTCVFPGCRMPATECDLDHTRAWSEGGPTTTDNLSPLCRHDHRLKHSGWRMKRIRPGIYQWTSPLGHTYTTGPDPP